jgi:predicted RNase H-like nuclease (RuvC/YqgF family)
MKEEVKSVQEKEKFPRETGEFTVVHRRWLVNEIASGRMSIQDALERFNFQSKSPRDLVKSWCKRYSPQIVVTLPAMTEKEKQKLEALHKRVKELEKELQHAQMKNHALETLIDVAEEQFKIPIRKKAGSRQ